MFRCYVVFICISIFVTTTSNYSTNHTNPVILKFRALWTLRRMLFFASYTNKASLSYQYLILLSLFCFRLWFNSCYLWLKNLQTFFAMWDFSPNLFATLLINKHLFPIAQSSIFIYNSNTYTLNIKNSTLLNFIISKISINLLSNCDRFKNNSNM